MALEQGPADVMMSIHQTQALTSELAVELSEISNVYRRFLDVHIIEFDVDKEEYRQETFFRIRDHLESLEDIRGKLQGLSVLCHEYAKNVSHFQAFHLVSAVSPNIHFLDSLNSS